MNMDEKEREYDIIVVGGGPAGSGCSIFLSRHGYTVLLVDKARFPRDKACGDGITGKAKALLEELNLVKEVETNPHAIFKGAILFINDQKLDVDFEEFYGYVSRRFVFDDIIFQTAKKLVDTMEDFTVNGLLFENSKVVGIKGFNNKTKEEKTFRAKIVVGADGANSVVARETGLAEFKPGHHASALRVYYNGIKGLTDKLEVYFFDNIMPGYFWIFPLEDGMANVGLGMSTDAIQKKHINLQDLLSKEIKTNQILVERFKDAHAVEGSLRGWNLPLVTSHRKMYGNGFVLLGDAASLIDPFTGEGIGPGLVSAKVAAQVIDEALRKGDCSEKVLSKYQKVMWKLYAKNYVKYAFLFKIIGNFKWLINRAFKKFANDESFKELVTISLADKKNRGKFTVWTGLKLLFKLIF